MTLGAVFGAVSTTAGAISGAVGTVASSVLLLDNFVNKALDEQKARHAMESENFDQRLLAELAQEQAQVLMAADAFCDQSENHRKRFTESHNRLSAALAKFRGTKDESTIRAVA